MSEEAKKVGMVPLRDLQIAEEKLRILESARRQIAGEASGFGGASAVHFGEGRTNQEDENDAVYWHRAYLEVRRERDRLRDAIREEEQTILPTCLRLHMSNTGSSDPLDDEEELAMCERLRGRLLGWQERGNKSTVFDEAVRMLIVTTLAETDIRRERFPVMVKVSK